MEQNEQNEPNKKESPAGHKDHLKEPWLEKYRDLRTITSTCRAFGLSRQTVMRWRKTDPVFNEKFQELEIELVEVLETTAYKRALDGSDILTIFLLKASNPQKYKDLVKHEVDMRFVIEVSAQLTAAVKKIIPNVCPDCKTHLGLTNKLAQELKGLSAKLIGHD